MKSLLAEVGAGVIAVTMLAQPAEAAPRCVWKATYWQCWNGHSWYRDYRKRAEIRHDRRHVEHLERKLSRDMYYGNSAQVARDLHRLDRAHRELRQDRRELHYGR
jgi:hypothetical protein